MILDSFTAALLISASLANVVSASSRFEYRSFHRDPTPYATDVELPVAEFSLPVTRQIARSHVQSARLAKLRADCAGKTTAVTPVAGSQFNQQYLVNATVGGQPFSLFIDTGSSDTWVIEKGFQCYNETGYPQLENFCAFGTSGYDPSKSKTYSPYPNHNFNQTYAGGEFAAGPVGFETIEVGGLSVPKQQFGLVERVSWPADGIFSGLLGLATPNLTSMFVGNSTANDSFANLERYNPFFFTAVKDKLVSKPYFSLALNRGDVKAAETNVSYTGNAGHLAFGGVAPVATTSPHVRVPFQGYNSAGEGSGYFYWIAQIDEFIFPGSSNLTTTSNITILDSGSTINYLPSDIAAVYNAAFDPPAVYNATAGGYVIKCTAKAPPFSVVIGGKAFVIDPRDQLFYGGGVKDADGDDLCFSGTQDGGSVTSGLINILGSTFLHNVVATFDVSAHELTLSQRKMY